MRKRAYKQGGKRGKSFTLWIQDLLACSALIYPQGGSFLISEQGKGSMELSKDALGVEVDRESHPDVCRNTCWQYSDIRKLRDTSHQLYS